jgi:hypothetical protein
MDVNMDNITYKYGNAVENMYHLALCILLFSVIFGTLIDFLEGKL